jgi:cell division protein FtsZ
MTELAKSVDAIITIPNDRIADVVADDTSMLDAFRVVDDVLLQVVRGIIDLLRGPGLINLDFADVRAIMHGAGPTLIGLGHGSGEGRALEAARQAIASPLLEARIQGARGILFNVSGPPDLNLSEVRLAADEIRASADPDANIIFGASLGRPAGEDVVITLIATGLERPGGTETAAVDEGTAGEATPAEPPEAVIEPAETEPSTDGGEKSQPEVVARAQPHALPTKAPVSKAPTPSSGGRISGAPGAKRVDVEMPSFLRRKRPS